MSEREDIQVCKDLCELQVPHLGFTLRSLLAAAANAAKEVERPKRTWAIVYKNVTIGNVRIRTRDLEAFAN